MTTIKSIASAVEGSGGTANDAFSVIKSVVKVVQEKEEVQAGSDAGVAIDFTDTEDNEITSKVR